MPKNDTSDELMAALMKHRGRLDRWLRRFGIDDGERPDIIQRAAEKVWLSLRGTRCPNDVGGLLHTAVKNLAIDRHRELGTRMEALPLLSIDDAASPNPEDELHKQRLWMCVRQAIDSLPERSAEVLRMRFFDELSVQELARALDISLASAYRAVDTALEELERELGRRIEQQAGAMGGGQFPQCERHLAIASRIKRRGTPLHETDAAARQYAARAEPSGHVVLSRIVVGADRDALDAQLRAWLASPAVDARKSPGASST